ncbi:MAG: FHA domain-containing protein [Prevotella sp.]|nr:FHA domain-containing protein [Prevotella sp.]
MIICPSCKEEIEEESQYCDQCGQELVYCSSCGRVGMGRRCTYCGGLMASPGEAKAANQQQQSASYRPAAAETTNASYTLTSHRPEAVGSQLPSQNGVPTLTLYNPSLDIRMVGVNGAIIGRRQGPYTQLFEGNMYISGVHAQLIYKPDSGWCIIDKHSSNGTKLNQRDLQPDIPMSIKSGDIVTLANINLQVSVN